MGMWWRKTEAESKGIVMDTLAKTCFSFRVVAPFFQVTRTPWPIVGITVRYPNPEVCTRPPRATKSEPQHLPSRTPLVAMLRDAARLDANDRRLPATQQSSGAEQKHGGGEGGREGPRRQQPRHISASARVRASRARRAAHLPAPKGLLASSTASPPVKPPSFAPTEPRCAAGSPGRKYVGIAAHLRPRVRTAWCALLCAPSRVLRGGGPHAAGSAVARGGASAQQE